MRTALSLAAPQVMIPLARIGDLIFKLPWGQPGLAVGFLPKNHYHTHTKRCSYRLVQWRSRFRAWVPVLRTGVL